MLRQGAVHRENRFSSWLNETGLLRFYGNKTTQFFSGQSDWPADNSRKVRLAGMPAVPMVSKYGFNYVILAQNNTARCILYENDLVLSLS